MWFFVFKMAASASRFCWLFFNPSLLFSCVAKVDGEICVSGIRTPSPSSKSSSSDIIIYSEFIDCYFPWGKISLLKTLGLCPLPPISTPLTAIQVPHTLYHINIRTYKSLECWCLASNAVYQIEVACLLKWPIVDFQWKGIIMLYATLFIVYAGICTNHLRCIYMW